MPSKFVPIILEFQLCDQNDAIITPVTYDATPHYSGVYATVNMTNSWQTQNCCIEADIRTLDSSLNNEYISHMLSCKSLNIEYSTYISQQSSIVGKSFSVQVIRAVSRLQRAFITFYADNSLPLPLRKPSITFHHPMAESPLYNPDKELQIYMQLGSKLYPEYPCNNTSECFYRLKEAMNLPILHQHAISIKFKSYFNNKFIFCVSFEKNSRCRVDGSKY